MKTTHRYCLEIASLTLTVGLIACGTADQNNAPTATDDANATIQETSKTPSDFMPPREEIEPFAKAGAVTGLRKDFTEDQLNARAPDAPMADGDEPSGALIDPTLGQEQVENGDLQEVVSGIYPLPEPASTTTGHEATPEVDDSQQRWFFNLAELLEGQSIERKYASLGGRNGFLGAATTSERNVPVGIGRYRHYRGGSIYWSHGTGAWEVHGLIRHKWSQLGWERSAVGYPVSDEFSIAGGRANNFQRGTIMWKRGASRAYEVRGCIRSKYSRLDWHNGILGYPTTDESASGYGGRYNHFERGTIHWTPSTGAHETHGSIRHYWASRGWEHYRALGYPISDETNASNGAKYSDFENGVVYWKSGQGSRELDPMWLGGASKTGATMLQEMGDELVAGFRSADSRIYRRSGHAWSPNGGRTTAYTNNCTNTWNRAYRVRIHLGIDVTGPNPRSTLDLVIRVDYNKSNRQVTSTLLGYHIHTHVPWPTSWGVSASTINNGFAGGLDAQLGRPTVVSTVPAFINVLSVKVQANGDLHTVVEP